jgi:DNA-binding Lrp family transcriptional regulator
MDQLDFQILELLSNNSRISVTEISKQIGRSHSATRLRLAKIVDSGVIEKFTIILDEEIYGQFSNQRPSTEDSADLSAGIKEKENESPPPENQQTNNGVREAERINDSRPVIGSTSR